MTYTFLKILITKTGVSDCRVLELHNFWTEPKKFIHKS